MNVLAPCGDGIIRLIINIEAQNRFHPGYPLLKRAIYYASRLIAGQYGTVFTKSHYEKIQKVYTIWICTSPTKKWQNTINRYAMQEEHIYGKAKAPREHYDLIVSVLVCLGDEDYEGMHRLLKMLNLLFLRKMSAVEKKEELKEEYGIRLTPELEKGVEEMCNLSAGIKERARHEGLEEGRTEGRMETRLTAIKNIMDSLHMTVDETMKALKIPDNVHEKYKKLLTET